MVRAIDRKHRKYIIPTRKQVEELWRGKWIEYSDFWIRCSKCGDIWHRVWVGSHVFNFCPHCGAPLTDKAVELAMERMKKLKDAPTLTPPNISPDLISRSALLRGETEPEITTGSDSELAEHMEWERWTDKIKRAPAVDKEGLQ